ncbi:RCC1 domain-containing protein [Ruminococcus flavefaciens]|uniref:RCC1-like domain-containing protein n=1 Tax=Ruminococcus flavefaciens 007c TaxID=1341157 RepID=W7UVP0_RUMFL|nr:hypothetical protein [Ruminococcus flavefaciens]EWM52402.1 hypothetical protein RF007C_13715 [Ruminococcus flavefaciens 007c]
MKKLFIINILLCALTATLTSCSEKTISENKERKTKESRTVSTVTASAAEQTSENITLQTSSVSLENTTVTEAVSINVTNLPNIERISLGGSHTGFVTEDGSLYVWGCGFEYQLGNGEHSIAEKPIKIMDDVEKICFGFENSAAVTKDGSLYIWGKNKPIPDGPSGLFMNPATPEKIMEEVIAVSVGHNHTAIIKNDNTLYMWGDNYMGQLGNGKSGMHEYSDSPLKIMKDVRYISLGFLHSAAVTCDGSLYTWGCNRNGQLGNGKSGESEIESEPLKIMDNVQYVSLGGEQSAAITEDGSLYMWGQNDFGQVGNGKSGESEIQTEPVKIMDNVQYVSLGLNHSAAITKDGNLYMWGSNDSGQLGNGEEGYKAFSAVPIKIMDNVEAVKLGNGHSGALTKDGKLYMWGNNRLNGVGEIETDNGLVLVPTRIDIIDNS